MAEAMALAGRGLGAVEPNPMVGAVIVRDGHIIGRGWHKRFGGPHAEAEALADARAAGEPTDGATMYVTLEPCSHHGKAPPCTEAICRAKIAAVVAAIGDPSPEVAGQGFAQLRAAGVEVTVGVGRHQAHRLLGAYLKLRTEHRPWVIGKWAQTLDGRIATRTGDSRWISNERSRRRVHRLRGCCDGVAVGVGTALADDPLLTDRSGGARQPTRVVLDERLELSDNCQLIRTIDQAPLLIATGADAMTARADHAEKLRSLGAELLALPAGPGGVDLAALLEELGRREWTRLLVEGGASVLGSILRAGLADELWVFLAPKLLGGREGVPCVLTDEIDKMSDALTLPAPTVEAIDGDLLLTYHLRQG